MSGKSLLYVINKSPLSNSLITLSIDRKWYMYLRSIDHKLDPIKLPEQRFGGASQNADTG